MSTTFTIQPKPLNPLKPPGLLQKLENSIKAHPFIYGAVAIVFARQGFYLLPEQTRRRWEHTTDIISNMVAGAVNLYSVYSMRDMLDPGCLNLKAPHRNLTQKAKAGKLSVMVGREDVIDQIMGVLICSDKPNAVLVGPPGVGKTAIAEGLALRLAKVQHPKLKNCELIEIKVSEFIGGAGILGQFERRIGQFISDVENAPHLIIFIDEIHALTKLGTGSTNARDILKPMLARGKARIVGCTTSEESKMLLEDGAFNRRFHRIDVTEPKIDMLKNIIYARAQEYATFHQCAYEGQALHAAIAHSYSLPGYYPDKTLALLDRAGGLVSLRPTREPPIYVHDISMSHCSRMQDADGDRVDINKPELIHHGTPRVTRSDIMGVVEDVRKTVTHR